MTFVHSDLGHLDRGDVVEVTLSGNQANVRLLDSSNFTAYKNGRRHTFHGGRATRSPVRIEVPATGRWHVAVDMQRLGGQTRASTRVIKRAAFQPLPAIRERRPELRTIADNLADARPTDDARDFDVFISHASEDKDAIVRPLAESLRDSGLDVWYDEFELRIGDSLRRKIDAGIARSRFGIVVLSKHFFAKGWPAYELDGLVTMTVNGKQGLLPLWHGISKDEVLRNSPSLADKVALRTADYTVAEIAAQIADVVQNPR